MREALYMTIVHILDRHRTWLEIVNIDTVRTHAVIKNGRMTGIPCRMLAVKAFYNHFPYVKGQVWQIAEYDLEHAVKNLRAKDGAFRNRIVKDRLTAEDVERVISAATHGIVHPCLSSFPIFTCNSYHDK